MQTTYLVRCALQQATSTDLARLLDKLKVIAGFGHDTDQLVTGVRFPYHHRLALNLSLVHISPQPFDVEIEIKKKRNQNGKTTSKIHDGNSVCKTIYNAKIVKQLRLCIQSAEVFKAATK